jgi:hypothetical protein
VGSAGEAVQKINVFTQKIKLKRKQRIGGSREEIKL